MAGFKSAFCRSGMAIQAEALQILRDHRGSVTSGATHLPAGTYRWNCSSVNNVSPTWRSGSALWLNTEVVSRSWAARRASARPHCYRNSRSSSETRAYCGGRATRSSPPVLSHRCMTSRGRRRARYWRPSIPQRTARRSSPQRSMSWSGRRRWLFLKTCIGRTKQLLTCLSIWAAEFIVRAQCWRLRIAMTRLARGIHFGS